MNTQIIITAHAAIAAACWLISGAGATVAVFSARINDTVTERIGLAWIALGCASAAYRIVKAGWISEGGLMLSMGLAFYVCSLFWKHWHRIDARPGDKA